MNRRYTSASGIEHRIGRKNTVGENIAKGAIYLVGATVVGMAINHGLAQSENDKPATPPASADYNYTPDRMAQIEQDAKEVLIQQDPNAMNSVEGDGK